MDHSDVVPILSSLIGAGATIVSAVLTVVWPWRHRTAASSEPPPATPPPVPWRRRWVVATVLSGALAITFAIATLWFWGIASSQVHVEISELSSPVEAGTTATLSAKTHPNADCAIFVVHRSGCSTAQGLVPKQADASGEVSWTWLVGSATTADDWPVTVLCSAGTRSAFATEYLTVK